MPAAATDVQLDIRQFKSSTKTSNAKLDLASANVRHEAIQLLNRHNQCTADLASPNLSRQTGSLHRLVPCWGCLHCLLYMEAHPLSPPGNIIHTTSPSQVQKMNCLSLGRLPKPLAAACLSDVHHLDDTHASSRIRGAA